MRDGRAAHRGNVPVTKAGYASIGYSRGASALGLALGEVASSVPDDAVLRESHDWCLCDAPHAMHAAVIVNILKGGDPVSHCSWYRCADAVWISGSGLESAA